MGTRDHTQTQARRGAALIASMAQAPIVPAHYSGPSAIRLSHLLKRPAIVVRFGPSIDTASAATGSKGAAELTTRLDRAIKTLAA